MSGDFAAVLTNGLAAIKSMGKAAADSLGGLAGKTESAGDEAKKAAKHFRDLGAAIARMGGPIGEVAGKFFGARGMEGGLAKLAVTAVAIGVAFKVFDAAMERSRAKAKAFADAAAGLREALRAGEEASRDFAAGAESIGRTQVRAENLFGADAGKRAGKLAGENRIEASDVLDAMASSGAIPKSQREAALAAAMRASATGEGKASDFMGMMSDPATRARVLGQQTGGGLSSVDRGAAMLIMSHRGARGEGAFKEAVDTLGMSSPARSQLGGINSVSSYITKNQQDAFTSGKTTAALTGKAARQVDAVDAAMQEWIRSQLAAIQNLREAAKAANQFAEDYKDAKDIITGGEGSFDTQAGNASDAFNRALKGMQGSTK